VNKAVERAVLGWTPKGDQALAETVRADVQSGALARKQPGLWLVWPMTV
jgi:hypothetical protein